MNQIFLKGFLFSAALLASTVSASAEGYQVNTLSTRQLGMGHTGTALKLGSESQFFNPAGMAFMESGIDASASFNAIFPKCTAIVGEHKYYTDNKASTPMSAFAAFTIYPSLKAGISIYTPYGSSINWTDNWPGATLNQKVDLKTYTVQPTVAWRPLPRLAVGAGLTMTWGSVDLNKGLISAAEVDGLLAAMGMKPVFGDITPASANLTGKANVAFGANLGVLYDISGNVSVGANFRTKNLMKVKSGTTTVEYATEDPTIKGLLASKLDGITKTTFKAEMPLPSVLSFGAAWHNDRVTAAFDAQLTFWHTYRNLDIRFDGLSELDQHLTKNYHNAWMLKGGVEWKTTPRLDLRAGLCVDFSPVDKEYYNPETPGMTKIEPTVGLTFRPLPCLGVNLACMYVAGCGVDNASYTSPGVLTGKPDTFTADYRLHSWTGSVGLSLSF